MAGPAMSGLRRITGWGNIGALRAFGKGFVLRNAFRGKPIGSLRPRSSGIGLKRLKCASRPMRSVPKSKLMVVPAMSGLRRITGWEKLARFALRVLSIGIEMHVALLDLRLLRPRSRLGSWPFCCGSNMNVVLMSRWTVVFFGERRILPTVYLVCQLKRKRALVIV